MSALRNKLLPFKISTRLFQNIFKLALIIILVYTPLLFGGVHLIFRTPVLILIFLLTILFAWHLLSQTSFNFQKKLLPLYTLMGVFFLLIFFQLLPLPQELLNLISPSSQKFCNQLVSETAGLLDNICHNSISVDPAGSRSDLVVYLSLFLLFLLTVEVIEDYRSLKLISLVIIGAGLLQALYGLYGFVSSDYYLFWFRRAFGFSATGTFVNRNHFAASVGMTACFTIGYFMALPPERKTASSRSKKSLILNYFNSRAAVQALVLFGIILIMFISVVFSLSRMGIMSLLGALSVMITLNLMYRKSRKVKYILVAALLLMLVSLFLAIKPLEVRYEQSLHSLYFKRGAIWEATLKLIADFPLFGSGLGSYENIFKVYGAELSMERLRLIDHAHNDYLELLAETGVVGFLIVLAAGLFFLQLIYRGWLNSRNFFSRGFVLGGMGSIIYLLLHSLTDFNLHIYANGLLITVIAALSYICLKLESGREALRQF